MRPAEDAGELDVDHLSWNALASDLQGGLERDDLAFLNLFEGVVLVLVRARLIVMAAFVSAGIVVAIITTPVITAAVISATVVAAVASVAAIIPAAIIASSSAASASASASSSFTVTFVFNAFWNAERYASSEQIWRS